MSTEKDVFIDADKGKTTGPLEAKKGSKSSGLSVLVVLALIAIIGVSLYLVFRGIAFLNPGYNWLDRLFATLLLIAECFLLMHTIGYISSVIRSVKGYRTIEEHFFTSASYPPPPSWLPLIMKTRKFWRKRSSPFQIWITPPKNCICLMIRLTRSCASVLKS